MRLQMKDSKEIMKGTLPRGAYQGEAAAHDRHAAEKNTAIFLACVYSL